MLCISKLFESPDFEVTQKSKGELFLLH